MRSLPAVRPGIIGVLQVLRPGSAWISRERAIADYDRIPSVPTTEGRVVKTALARIAYLDRGQERQDTVWIVSVWYHPANVGVAHQRQWCVAHQLLQATTGAPFYGTGGCLPAGRHPVEVTSG